MSLAAAAMAAIASGYYTALALAPAFFEAQLIIHLGVVFPFWPARNSARTIKYDEAPDGRREMGGRNYTDR